MKLSILIPAYNEAKTLKKVLSKIARAFGARDYELIIIEDGSTDATAAIAKAFIHADTRARFLRHNHNRGKGAAIRTGLAAATGDYIAIQDADLEYDPVILAKLWDLAKRERNVVYGVRCGDVGYAANRFGNRLLTGFCNLLFGSSLHDVYTCYKLIPRELADSLAFLSDGFEIEAEITAKLLKRNIPIIETSIPYVPRSFVEGKHIRARDGIKGLLTFLRIRFFS